MIWLLGLVLLFLFAFQCSQLLRARDRIAEVEGRYDFYCTHLHERVARLEPKVHQLDWTIGAEPDEES